VYEVTHFGDRVGSVHNGNTMFRLRVDNPRAHPDTMTEVKRFVDTRTAWN